MVIPVTGHDLKTLVVFVHGSGPQDRDETILANKPFKDIADGLAQHGIASYRFDKKTKVAPLFFSDGKYTVEDEVTNDVVNIVTHFRHNDTFSHYRIVLIGHSLGAMMMPEIIGRLKGIINGAVMMAGNARPLQEVLYGQIQYLNSLHPSSGLKAQENMVHSQVSYLNSSRFTLESPADSLPLGLPASYWMSLKKYDPLQTSKNSTIPLLIVQGGSDYQVSMIDFNLWEKTLGSKSNVALKAYPSLNHLFMQGSVPPGPDDYKTAGHVSPSFINDIALWISQIK